MTCLLRNTPCIVAVAALLAACTTLSPSALMKFSRFNPLEFDPGAMRVALILPEPLVLKRGDVSLAMGWQATETPQHYLGSFHLDLLSGNAAAIALNGEVKAGQKIVLLTMSVSDAQRMRELQGQIGNAKRAGLKGKGYISMSFDGGCWNGAVSPSEQGQSVAAWLQASPVDTYFPVLGAVDLKDILKEQGIDTLPTCQDASPDGALRPAVGRHPS
jgi:hypothetical protein